MDWAVEHPESIPIFEKYGIDYSCGGKSLEYACRQRAINPQAILAEIRQQQTERAEETE